MNDSLRDEPRDADENVTHPFRTGLSLSAITLLLFVVAAVIVTYRHGELLKNAAWHWVAMIPVGLIVSCFGFAYLGAVIGRRRSKQIIGLILVVW